MPCFDNFCVLWHVVSLRVLKWRMECCFLLTSLVLTREFFSIVSLRREDQISTTLRKKFLLSPGMFVKPCSFSCIALVTICTTRMTTVDFWIFKPVRAVHGRFPLAVVTCPHLLLWSFELQQLMLFLFLRITPLQYPFTILLFLCILLISTLVIPIIVRNAQCCRVGVCWRRPFGKILKKMGRAVKNQKLTRNLSASIWDWLWYIMRKSLSCCHEPALYLADLFVNSLWPMNHIVTLRTAYGRHMKDGFVATIDMFLWKTEKFSQTRNRSRNSLNEIPSNSLSFSSIELAF